VPNHTTIKTAPRWDVSNVYPALDSAEFQADFERLDRSLEELIHYLNENHIQKSENSQEKRTPRELGQLLDHLIQEVNNIMELSGTIRAYISAFVSTDSYNAEARKALSLWEQRYVSFQQAFARIQGWVGAIGDRIPEVLPYSKETRRHEFALREIAEQSQYMMSQAEEELAAELGVSGAGAWAKLQGTITSQLSIEIEVDGKTKKLPAPALINLRRNHPDEATRRRAFEAEIAAWDSVKEPLAACLNGVKGYVITLNKRRGRKDALHSALDNARMDRETLETMLAAMQASFPTFQQYFKAKAKRLGKKALAWWDLFAPVGKTDTRYTFAQATDLILTQFGAFSPDLAAFAERAFESNWIDAQVRDGKRGGAFCMSLPKVRESRILCNFDGSLDSVFTLAHELGHGYHNECKKHKTMLQQSTPMTLAETASIMCETIIFEAAIRQASTPEEELAILETSLIGDSQVIVDIYSRFLFEKEVFERREEAELSAQDFCEIMEQAQEATYGPGLDERYRHKYMWAWKPHYYRPGLSFYNFPYAFGLLFGIGLYSVYQERGDVFLPAYRELLASTGEGTVTELAARFDIDIRKPAFWENSLQVIGQRIERYINL